MGPKGQKLVVRAWGITRPGPKTFAEPQFRQNLKDDYEHEIRRQQSLQKKKVLAEEKDLPEKKPTSKKCGKQVPQPDTQKNNRSPRS
jgi:hypothetical protein